MKISTFLLCKNPALSESGIFIFHTKNPRCLVRIHVFNTYNERDAVVFDIGAISLKMPTSYECIILIDECNDALKLASLMRRIADWHFAISNIKIE